MHLGVVNIWYNSFMSKQSHKKGKQDIDGHLGVHKYHKIST